MTLCSSTYGSEYRCVLSWNQLKCQKMKGMNSAGSEKPGLAITGLIQSLDAQVNGELPEQKFTPQLISDVQQAAGGMAAPAGDTNISASQLGMLTDNKLHADFEITTTQGTTMLLSTIINAGQQKAATEPMESSSQIKQDMNMDSTLPLDLQSFRADPFTAASPTIPESITMFQSSVNQPQSDIVLRFTTAGGVNTNQGSFIMTSPNMTSPNSNLATFVVSSPNMTSPNSNQANFVVASPNMTSPSSNHGGFMVTSPDMTSPNSAHGSVQSPSSDMTAQPLSSAFAAVSSSTLGGITSQSMVGLGMTSGHTNMGVGVTSPQPGLLSSLMGSPQQIPSGFTEALHVHLPDRSNKTPSFDNLPNGTQCQFDSPGNHGKSDKSSMLERLLTGDRTVEDNYSTQTSPGSHSVSSPDFQIESPTSISSNSPYTEMGNSAMFTDISINTQSSLIIGTEKVSIDSLTQDNIATADENMKPLDMFPLSATSDDDEVQKIESSNGCKAKKLFPDPEKPSSAENLFDEREVVPSSDFTFSKFGKNLLQFVATTATATESTHSTTVSSISTMIGSGHDFKTPQPLSHTITRKQMQARRSKEPLLCQQFYPKANGYELQIVSQPEEQHRARYLTEGSRGSVKNRSPQQGYPEVKLFGHNGEATLQVFIGNDSGRTRPHGFYQACKVCGKNSTACTESEIDRTTVIEMELKPENEMTATIDCVGILKLRNADVEQRIGISKAKKKSTKARMIFRTYFMRRDGNMQTLQVASCPILCTQPIGQPEISKMSLKSAPASGGDELFVIGKNFLRGSRVFFQEIREDDTSNVVWERESDIDKDYFHNTHLVCVVPEYTRAIPPDSKATCQVLVNSGGKISDPHTFTYQPAEQPVVIKQEVPMETCEETKKRPYPFVVAPEALQLNERITQTQQTSNTPDMFQLPPGIISSTLDPCHIAMETSTSRAMTAATHSDEQPMSFDNMSQNDELLPKRASFSLPDGDFPDNMLQSTTNRSESPITVLDKAPFQTLSPQNSFKLPVSDVTDYQPMTPMPPARHNDPGDNTAFGQPITKQSSSDQLTFPLAKIGISDEPVSEAEASSIVSQFLENMSNVMASTASSNQTFLASSFQQQTNTTQVRKQTAVPTELSRPEGGQTDVSLCQLYSNDASITSGADSTQSPAKRLSLGGPQVDNVLGQMKSPLISAEDILGLDSIVDFKSPMTFNEDAMRMDPAVFSLGPASTPRMSAVSTPREGLSVCGSAHGMTSAGEDYIDLTVTTSAESDVASQSDGMFLVSKPQAIPDMYYPLLQSDSQTHQQNVSALAARLLSQQTSVLQSGNPTRQTSVVQAGNPTQQTSVLQAGNPTQQTVPDVSQQQCQQNILQPSHNQQPESNSHGQSLASRLAAQQQNIIQSSHNQQPESASQGQSLASRLAAQQQNIPQPSHNQQPESTSQGQSLASHLAAEQQLLQSSTLADLLTGKLTPLSRPPPAPHTHQTAPVMTGLPTQQTQAGQAAVMPTYSLEQIPQTRVSTASNPPAAPSVPPAPQIIICNNPAQPGILNQGQQFGAPSIVIVPGGNPASQNNQVESLLRSILGSLTPAATPTPAQPQASLQQPEQHGNQQQQHGNQR